MLSVNDFQTAARRLKNVIHTIPLSSSKTFSEMSGAEVYLKYENQQKTGSFKVRGAYNKIMKRYEEGGLSAVVASSAGNHAQGVAFAASQIGVPATIVMPRSTPIAKVSATEGYGAKVVLHGSIYDEAYAKACEIVEEEGAEFIHPFDDEDVMAGQGTIALEILSDLPTVDMIFVPAGGGGLVSGIAACAKQINPRIRSLACRQRARTRLSLSFQKEHVIPSSRVHTIADGIAVKTPGAKTHAVHQPVCRSDDVTVSDAEIAGAILLLLERTKQVVEPAGAASLAAVLNHKADVAGKKVCCVLSGGNIDVSFIHKVVERVWSPAADTSSSRPSCPTRPVRSNASPIWLPSRTRTSSCLTTTACRQYRHRGRDYSRGLRSRRQGARSAPARHAAQKRIYYSVRKQKPSRFGKAFFIG